MKIRQLVLAALVVGSMAPGCGGYDDPCAAGYANLFKCGLVSVEQSSAYLSFCNSSPETVCMFGCFADSSCEDITFGRDESVCYPPTDTDKCINVCFGRDPDYYDCSTPLVLSFDDTPVRFEQSDRFFDFGIGASIVTDWPDAATPWLALDRNGDGAIDDATELFGSSTPLRAGGRGANGFIALRELDSDGDGQITSADQAWASLVVWSDRNGDRVSSRDELSSLEARGVTAIDLVYARQPRCDARGNCEGERAGIRFRSGAGAERSGSVVDVYLRWQ